ncbi:MAG: hypothetical protein EPN33_04275 [Acidobacteria bacterium]|nr:MAG: hypothetical protein EPN33_04275 [Acidobacteriota bacterium]
MRLIRVILLGLVVIDLSLVLALMRTRSAYHFESGPFRSGVRAITLPSGFLADGTLYRPPSDRRCALLQYTSTLCPDCDLNWIVASRLSDQLQSLGCEAIRLAPSPEQLPLRQAQLHEIEIGWVRPSWLEKLPRLEMEPTAIALGPDGRIVWYTVGELSRGDVQAAIAKVRHALH